MADKVRTAQYMKILAADTVEHDKRILYVVLAGGEMAGEQAMLGLDLATCQQFHDMLCQWLGHAETTPVIPEGGVH